MPSPRSERRSAWPMPRFTIRDLLWFTLVVGMAVGWWVDRVRVMELWEERYESLAERYNALANRRTIEYEVTEQPGPSGSQP